MGEHWYKEPGTYGRRCLCTGADALEWRTSHWEKEKKEKARRNTALAGGGRQSQTERWRNCRSRLSSSLVEVCLFSELKVCLLLLLQSVEVKGGGVFCQEWDEMDFWCPFCSRAWAWHSGSFHLSGTKCSAQSGATHWQARPCEPTCSMQNLTFVLLNRVGMDSFNLSLYLLKGLERSQKTRRQREESHRCANEEASPSEMYRYDTAVQWRLVCLKKWISG